MLALAALVVVVWSALSPSVAAADACPSSVDTSYTGNCGPWFAVPNWTDAGGWDDPAKYSTIQLADVNGDGSEELIGRADDGIEIFWFDTTLGQWRPQVDSSGNRQALTDFATPPPWEASDPHSPAQPQYYSTIQAADIDGQPGAEILGRFWDGMRVYKYTPPQGSQIDGGSWAKIGTGGPFSDSDGWGDPSRYLTIKTADTDGAGQAELVSRTSTGVAVYGWTGSAWAAEATQTDALFGGDCGDVRCYSGFQPFNALGPADNWLLARPGGGAPANQQGVQMLRGNVQDDFLEAQPPAQSPQDPGAGPFNSQSGWPDCLPGGKNTECFDASPSYYETLRAADIDGVPGDEVLGRLDDGLHAWRYRPFGSNTLRTIDDADPSLSGSWSEQWSHATNVQGAIDGTETSGSNAEFEYLVDASDVVRIIGPKGPDLEGFTLFVHASDWPDDQIRSYTVSQYAPQRTEQQVLWTGVAPPQQGLGLIIQAGSGTAVIDAIQTADFDGQWSSLATLGALSGIGSALNKYNQNGFWGSIRTGDIDGDGKDEVLHLFGEPGLLAWSYDPQSDAWDMLPADPPLALGDDPWLSHPEYYSTIQVGDVDGDGRDDVIARGPSGIRTWFYNRRGSGGWERYLPDGYPAFAGRQQAAYEALNALAHSERAIPETASSVRDVWVSESDPQILSSQLATLLGTGSGGLGTIAGCSGLRPGNPPRYQTCVPPFGEPQRTFAVLDWTAVVNELLSEIYAASNVVAFFQDLGSMREYLLMQEGVALPDIGHELGLQAAAASTTQFDFHKFLATTFGIAGSMAGALDPAVGAPLSAAAYVLSALPSGSSTAANKFETTYAGLQHQLDDMVTQVTTSQNVQSHEVRGDAGLLGLVDELVSSGTWQFDTYGMQSAGSQGFAIWIYQSLVPTISDRYKITNCWDGHGGPFMYCSGVPPSVGAFGNPNDLDTAGGMKNFVYPGPQFQGDGTAPCAKKFGDNRTCIYYGLSSDILGSAWGSLPAGCIYKGPRHPETMWKSSCPIGDDPELSVHQNTWGFNTYCGDFVAKSCSGAAAATAAGARRGAPIVLGRPRLGRRHAARGRARFRAEIDMPRGLRLAGATVGVKRLLFEPRGRGELTRPRGSRAPRLRLRRTGPGRFSGAARSGRPRARIALRRIGRRRALLTLTAGARAFRAPRACHALPASVALETPRLELETRLVIRNGRARRRIVVPHHMRCRRDAAGNIDRLVYIRNRPHRLRPGLAVTLRGPRRVRPGTTARYVVRVHNRRRRGGDRLVSSLWDVTLTGGGRTTRTRRLRSGGSRRIRELPAGRTRRLAFTIRVPRAAHGRLCADAVAAAPGARADRARACSRVQAAGAAPKVTG